MQDNLLNAFAEQAKNFYAPMSKFNSVFVENMEKMTEFQLEAIKSYADLGMTQMKKAAEIKDAESLREYSSAQAEAASTINKKIMDDAKKLSDMSLTFKKQVETIVEEGRATATAAATAATTGKTEKRAAKA